MSDPRRSRRLESLLPTNVGQSTSTALSLENGLVSNKKRSTRLGESSVELANRHFHLLHTESTALPPSAATFTRSLPPKCAEPGTKDKRVFYIVSSMHEVDTGDRSAIIVMALGMGNLQNTLRERIKFGNQHFPTTRLICKGYGKVERYNLNIEPLLPSEFTERFPGVTLGWQDGNDATRRYLDVNSPEAKEADLQCRIYYLAKVDENDNYGYEDARISFTASNLKSMAVTTTNKIDHVFKGKVRALNITLPGVDQGVLMQTGTSLDNHVVDTHTFETLELAEEHQSKYNTQTGVLEGNEGAAWLASVQNQPTASYDLMKEGNNEVVNVSTSRNALKHMRNGKDTSSAGLKPFDEWLKEQKLGMVKKKAGGGKGQKSHFVNPTMLPENGAVLEKGKFGVDATYTIKGVISND